MIRIIVCVRHGSRVSVKGRVNFGLNVRISVKIEVKVIIRIVVSFWPRSRVKF
jgi:hypothetical protein